MDERPAKRTKRTTSAAMWDEDEKTDSRPGSSGRDHKPKPRDIRDEDRRGPRRDDERRRRSRSRDTPDGRRERSRSKERPAHRDRNRDKERDRDRDRGGGGRGRDVNGHGRRERSKSRDRKRDSKDHRAERSYRRSRSRSPARTGGRDGVRTRSPLRRSDHDRTRPRDRNKPDDEEPRAPKPKDEQRAAQTEKPLTNGDAMAVDEDDEDALLRKMMGFTTFKSTQNTKVPGNQIYGTFEPIEVIDSRIDGFQGDLRGLASCVYYQITGQMRLGEEDLPELDRTATDSMSAIIFLFMLHYLASVTVSTIAYQLAGKCSATSDAALLQTHEEHSHNKPRIENLHARQEVFHLLKHKQ
ncbi:hypothetical protein AYL99_03581 [Fonsecaea erecta]|uniref:U4/U6.U5 small nuclear ribonucleoprotein 27kDa protein domain-containing protein n=1 Tax=Fonsecaea erecta TaxID=1367422 RepID=A0A178ZNI1_9EURO|nr:hypothetical protein AYL99_03581 [Fonsecaea erecta]OAP61378.1 hypothetical protein AYL99_03581 [Fonsecaea erecta]